MEPSTLQDAGTGDDLWVSPGYLGHDDGGRLRPPSVFALFAAHSGCGASTVRFLLDPDERGLATEIPEGAAFEPEWVPVVVARGSVRGAACAAEVLERWPHQLPLPWLVVSADAPGSLVPRARAIVRVARSRAAGVGHVPYLHRLRSVVHPEEAAADRAVVRASADLRHQLSRPRVIRVNEVP